MNFNVDRIAQLAGLSNAGGGASSNTLNESATRRQAQPATTYDRVVEELQLRGLELFYTPAQINEAIRSERRLLREEREMEMEGKCPKCGKSPCKCADEGMHSEDEGMHADDEGYHSVAELLDRESDEMAYADEAYAVGTKITDPDGTEYKITKASSGAKAAALAESKLRKLISGEVDRVLAEMSNSGDTAWMYSDRKRPTTKTRGATMGFAGVGFKR